MATQAITTRELDRARHIHDQLARVPAEEVKEHADRLKGSPAECMDNGLLQTLAFYHHKGKVHGRIAGQLEDWLRQRGLLAGGDSLETLARLDAVSYRRCSEEAIAWLNLAKRLAAARVALRRNR